MLGEYKSRRPPKNFNLLYLENNELHFMSLKVSLLIQATHEEIQGKLHLCSRSIFFEPKNIAKPLLRIKFSCGVILRMLKNIQTKKVYKLIPIKKTQTEFKTILAKGPNFISEMLQQQQQKKSTKGTKGPVYLQKLYEPIKKSKSAEDEKQKQKISNCFFIRVPKIFIIYRKPISPYITEKSDQSHIFQINKANNKNKVLRFLKLYDEVIRCVDQEKLNRSIIAATAEESAQQILEAYQQQKLQASHIIRCRRINIQGPQFGQFVLLKNKVKFYPLVNCPDNQIIEFTYRQIKFITRYRFLFQQIGIEIWLYNYPYSLLFVFNEQSMREMVYRHLKEKGEKIMKLELGDIVNMWSNGEITNVQYLNFVNIIANRSHNDLSQYPIFPWIIHNYDTNFDIRSHQMYRDLTKPIGAINKHRLKKLKDLYEIQTRDKTCTNPPHLYPTHYSTPGYVSYYLIRKIPQFIVRIQNGVFSPSDRIFRCVQSAYYMSMNSPADFKELIPEFYSTECDFLINSEKLQMGSTPQGEIIDDVIIPKWAANGEDFLLKMRAAFESDYVSATLSEWVDLIFGYKQNGTSAITSDNIFYFMTYQQNVSFDKVMSRMQKAALQVQISQFGQTPLQIFQEKHPAKRARILNLDMAQNTEDKKILSTKMIALAEQNQRLQQELQRQRYRFNKKLNEKQQLLIRNQRQKKKQVQKIREKLSIDSESLKKFEFRHSFRTEQQKDVYVRQIEQLLKERERQNHEMNVIIAGMKRQVHEDKESVCSNIEENVRIEQDFFDD